MTDIVIVAAQRTAVGKFGGTLARTAAPDLGAHVIKGLLAKAGVPGDAVSEVILGQVLAAGSGQNPARQSVIKAGLPQSVPGMTINKPSRGAVANWPRRSLGDRGRPFRYSPADGERASNPWASSRRRTP